MWVLLEQQLLHIRVKATAAPLQEAWVYGHPSVHRRGMKDRTTLTHVRLVMPR
jgi:hypothetical protein